MTIPDIHKAFDDLLEPHNPEKQRERRKLGLTSRKAAWYRWQIKQGNLTLATQMAWLKKAGIETGDTFQFSRFDMIDFLHFSKRKDSIRSAANLGDDYLFEKYLIWVAQGRPAVISTGTTASP